jgi:hypothetical protein
MTGNSDAQDLSLSASGVLPVASRYNLPISTKGYAKVAWLMARSNASDLAIFKKFGELNMLNLLRLQAELQALQEKLRINYKHQENLPYQYSFKKIRQHDPAGLQASMNPLLIPVDSDDEDYCPTALHKLLKRIEKKLKAYST